MIYLLIFVNIFYNFNKFFNPVLSKLNTFINKVILYILNLNKSNNLKLK